MKQNLYDVMGVDKSVSPEELKRVYRKLAREHHPDREGGNTERMAEIAAAYDTLSDPEKRAQYDASGFIGGIKSPEDYARDLFMQVLNDFIEGDEPLIPAIRRAAQSGLANIEKEVKKARGLAEKLGKRCGKIKHKEGDASFVLQFVRMRAEKFTRIADDLAKQCEYIKIVQGWIEEYESEEITPPDAPPTRRPTMEDLLQKHFGTGGARYF